MMKLFRSQPRLVWSIWVLATAGMATLALASPARGDETLGGWTVTADANGIDIVIDNTTGLAGVHPFTEADLPEAESNFASGPFGSTLASVFWPGSAGGDFGSLSAELPIPSQLQPLFAQTNDPVRASAQYPAGPAAARYPAGGSNNAIEMTADADANGTTATAALADEQLANLVSFGSVKGTSSSAASSTAKAISDSELSGVSLLGGLIHIAGITSTANATSDGNGSSGKAVTHIGEITVLGQPASIGTDGLALPTTLSKSLGPVVGPLAQRLLNQAFSALGITVRALPSSAIHKGPSESVTSGGVRLKVVPNPAATATLVSDADQLLASIPGMPSQLATVTTLPGLLEGATLTVTLGRATATADASPPFNSVFTPSLFSAAAAPTASGSPGSSAAGSNGGSTVISTPGTPGVEGPALASAAAPASGRTGPSSGSSAQPLLSTPIDLSRPLRAGEVVLGLLAAAAAAYGLWRLARLLLQEELGPECPLGQENP